MTALGRELWVAGDELLTVSAKIKFGGNLGNTGISLRNAADAMLSNDWESVMGELEQAAVSSTDVMPEETFQGLVDLFCYVEPVPACEWDNARNSLNRLSKLLDEKQPQLLMGLQGEYRMKTSRSLVVVIEKLQKAAKLFLPGGFYMPADPRDDVIRAGRGFAREPEQRPFGWGRSPEEREREARRAALEERLLAEAGRAAQAVNEDSFALVNMAAMQLEEATSSGDSARKALLRQLVRELHPDRNAGREAEVLPAFRYVQQLRNEDK